MAVDQISSVSHDARRRAVTIGLAVLVIVGLSVLWLATRPTAEPVSTNASFLGVVTNTPSTEGIICVRPDLGEPSGITDGGDYCAKAYPSRGLKVESIQQGDRVRLVAFATRDKNSEDVSGALVLSPALGQPPAGRDAILRAVPEYSVGRLTRPSEIGTTERSAGRSID